jgi:hypothetical protein
MENRRERDLIHRDGVDPSEGDDLNFDDSSSVESYGVGVGGGGGSGASSSSPGDDDGGDLRSEVGLTERLTDIIVDESDGDLLIQQTNCEERLLQWLQALDMQVIGACRADERLKPLLKMNTVSGVSEDPLLTQLIQVSFVLRIWFDEFFSVMVVIKCVRVLCSILSHRRLVC